MRYLRGCDEERMQFLENIKGRVAGKMLNENPGGLDSQRRYVCLLQNGKYVL